MGLFTRHSEFYDFARGSQHWLYTTDDRPVIYQGQTYLVAPGMKRNSIVLTQELEKAALQITVPYSLPLLDMYRPMAPMQKVTVRVFRLQSGAVNANIIWNGVLTDIQDQDEHTVVLNCAGGLSTLTTNGLRRKWQKSCPLALYGSGPGQCNLDMESKRTDGVITTASGTSIKASAFAGQPDGWFTGGFVRWQMGGATEFRFVVNHIGDTLELLTPCAITTGQAIAAYPGCDHTIAGGCTKLNNIANYGGQPYIPLKNPMGGDPIF
jgi:uncharacterized phage protein (TIGR02218 family)